MTRAPCAFCRRSRRCLGTITKLFLSKPGGNTIYLFDEAGDFCYYYAHLDRYAPNLREGIHVSRGQVIAFVGSSGNASPEAPHLHFTIFQLGPEKRWWKGTPINPYPVLLHLLTMGGPHQVCIRGCDYASQRGQRVAVCSEMRDLPS